MTKILIRVKGDSMAKKKKTALRVVKKAAARKAAPKGKANGAIKSKPRTERRSSPRHQTLPGMEQVRNKALDRICEGISDVRTDTNRLRGEEADLQRQAVKAMQADKVTAYRFAGVELVLVPGDVKLRVRTLKNQQANADAVDEGEAEDTGEGQDAGVIADDLTDAGEGDDLAGDEVEA